MDVRLAFLSGAQAVVDAVARPDVAARWSEPSVLAGMSIGVLAAHLARAVVNTRSYVEGAAAGAGDGALLDAAGYYASIDGLDDPGSPINRDVLARAEQSAEPGAAGVAAQAHAARDALVEVLRTARADGVVEVIGGRRMRLDEYLRTRCVEIAVHLDDLGRSLDAPAPIPDSTATVAAEALAAFAVRRRGAGPVLRTLARAERPEVPVFPVL